MNKNKGMEVLEVENLKPWLVAQKEIGVIADQRVLLFVVEGVFKNCISALLNIYYISDYLFVCSTDIVLLIFIFFLFFLF